MRRLRAPAPGAAEGPADGGPATPGRQLAELRLGEVCGLDLSPMNAYRWSPYADKVDLAKSPWRALSAPFSVCTVDLQVRGEIRTRRARLEGVGVESR